MKGEILMRDPNRIDPLLRSIKEIWSKYPDLRLLQLLTNVTYSEKCDQFYVEDDRLLELLEEAKEKDQ